MDTRQASNSDDDSNGGEHLMPGTSRSRRRAGIGKHLANLLLAARATGRSRSSRSRSRSRSGSRSRSRSRSRRSRTTNTLFTAMGMQQKKQARRGHRRVRILALGDKPRGPMPSSWTLKLRKKVRLAVSSPCKLVSLLRDKYVKFMESVVSRGIGSTQGLGMANQSLMAGPLLYPQINSFASSRRSQIAPLPASLLLDLVSTAYILPSPPPPHSASAASSASPASPAPPPGSFTKHDMADLLRRSLVLFPEHA